MLCYTYIYICLWIDRAYVFDKLPDFKNVLAYSRLDQKKPEAIIWLTWMKKFKSDYIFTVVNCYIQVFKYDSMTSYKRLFMQVLNNSLSY